MNALDVIIIVTAASAVIGGYRLGFLARVVSWVGLAVGLYLGARSLPSVVESLGATDATGKLLVAALVLLGGGFVGQALGLLIGSKLHLLVPIGPLRLIDRTVGALVGLAGVLVSVWLLLPTMSDVPGWPSEQARNSRVARFVDARAPSPPDALQALRRLVGDNDFPRVFEALRPSPDTGPPPAESGLAPEVQATVRASTVKVEGTACRRLQEGSGFAAGPDQVVTNAHVVAGEDRTSVILPDGRRLPAVVTVFDPDRDLAVLRVAGLDRPGLPRATASEGDRGAVFGHPGGQDSVRVAPAAIRQRVEAVGRDLYDARQTRRDVFILAAALRPGDSGGPLVNSAGEVVGVAFAIAPDAPDTAYALTTRELEPVLAADQGARADTGPCLR